MLFRSFREILGSEVSGYFASADYERAGIDVIENTPEEILGVTVEMAERLEGRWRPHPDDEALQQEFAAIVDACGLSESGPCRIGAAFLREHRALLQ